MKKSIMLFLFAVLMMACKSKSVATSGTNEDKEVKKPEITILKPSEADAMQSKKAYDLGTRVLMTCNTSRFKPFSDKEATSSVIANTTEARLTRTCHKFRLKYGDFKDIKLVEVIHNEADNSYTYRYKANYSKAIANKELRVTMNNENKVSSIKSSDWSDSYSPQ